MRLLHTADWHLGRRLKGIDRTPEVAYALEQLLEHAQTLAVDALLVAGDIFDVASPPADAEKVAYNFFCRLHDANIPAVMIAGNHDSALRIEGVAKLLSHVGVQALGRPRKVDQGGLIELKTQHGLLRIAALPFASERRLLKTEDIWQKNDTEQRQHYKQVMSYLLKQLTQGFQTDSVNIIMAHLMIEGAKRAFSEVDYYSRDTYSLSAQMLPQQAQYIALGHIHSPQHIPNAAPTYYSGSLIQVDFGEAQEQKGINLVTVAPNRPAQVDFIPIPCQKPLKVLACHEDQLEELLVAHREHPGYLKVIVDLEAPRLGLADKVRQLCPQTLMIEPRYLTAEVEPLPPEASTPLHLDPSAEFRRYWHHCVGSSLPDAVIKAFEELYQHVNE